LTFQHSRRIDSGPVLLGRVGADHLIQSESGAANGDSRAELKHVWLPWNRKSLPVAKARTRFSIGMFR
jgi:hypothetical protein